MSRYKRLIGELVKVCDNISTPGQDKLGALYTIVNKYRPVNQAHASIGAYVKCLARPLRNELLETVYNSYVKWCKDSLIEPINRSSFSKSLNMSGIATTKRRSIHGVRFRQLIWLIK